MTMGSTSTHSKVASVQPRYRHVPKNKAEGATYTPKPLAEFVAKQVLAAAMLSTKDQIRILDPACGDGALLAALLGRLPDDIRTRAQVFGFDTDQIATHAARKRLRETYPDVYVSIEERDFLKVLMDTDSRIDQLSDLLPFKSLSQNESFDIVIANPPYVRTQIIGAKQAQRLAQRFGLTGRVDLYFPFLIGISQVLAPNGVAGVIVSNRFMTTKSGQAVRRHLLSIFHLNHVWDLGDTKLFDAAVLPAVLLASGRRVAIQEPTRFSSIYECNEEATEHTLHPLEALSFPNDTVAGLPDGRRFRIFHGTLDNGGNPKGVWRVATDLIDEWLATVNTHTWGSFSQIGKIRVGVKTTADRVFIRSDWNTMPDNERPELLRPLTTRKCARRFRAVHTSDQPLILYSHESTTSGRAPVDLLKYPKAAAYFEKYRAILEARTYVTSAGRRWYEIWVPQDPAAWSAPKLVFPDIAEKPIFWIDNDGSVVNGDCYWLRCEGTANPDYLWLALAVANSRFAEAFYDHRFHNKLYAGRRRFITQYVEHFPLPDPDSEVARMMIGFAKQIYDLTPSNEADVLASKLDSLVWRAFGLASKEIPR